jgi:hypothetical protein
VSDPFSELTSFFGFLEDRGFQVVEATQLKEAYAGGYQLAYESERVRVEIVLDHRGEVDAYLSHLDSPAEHLALGQFMDPIDPYLQRPPLMFGGGTRRERAFEILAKLLATHADRALQGDEEAFARAARSPEHQPRVLP